MSAGGRPAGRVEGARPSAYGVDAGLFDGVRQRPEGDGLGHGAVEIGAEAVFPIAVHGMSGHGDDGRVAPRGEFGLADARGGLEPSISGICRSII